MKKTLALMLRFLVPIAVFSGDNSHKVTCDGGRYLIYKAGTGLKLYIEANQIRLAKNKTDVITIPATAVTDGTHSETAKQLIEAVGNRRHQCSDG